MKDGSVAIHLKVLAIVMHKMFCGISLTFKNEFDTNYQTRSRFDVELYEDGDVKIKKKS